MTNEFPPSFEWSVSKLEDIRSWLPDLSRVPSSRELVLVDFDIRSYGDMIARFDNSRIPLANQVSEPVPVALGAEIDVPQHSNPLPSADEPSIPVRPIRSLRGKVAKDDHFDTTVTVPEVVLNASSDSTIRVKRSVRVKKVSEKIAGKEEIEFSHKVRIFLSSLFL
jgi:hypothetical protein